MCKGILLLIIDLVVCRTNNVFFCQSLDIETDRRWAFCFHARNSQKMENPTKHRKIVSHNFLDTTTDF